MDAPVSVMAHVDQCAEELRDAGIPCAGWQMWDGDDGLAHYWFDTGELAGAQADQFRVIVARYFPPADAGES